MIQVEVNNSWVALEHIAGFSAYVDTSLLSKQGADKLKFLRLLNLSLLRAPTVYAFTLQSEGNIFTSVVAGQTKQAVVIIYIYR